MSRFLSVIALLLVIPLSSQALTSESGTLRGFILGECPACAYDNWTSHVVEGLALPGLNDYGPSFLDPQTNGFGHFTLIPDGAAGDTILTQWQSVFLAAIEHDWLFVDSFLVAKLADWNYELVHFYDTELDEVFYIIRETLDDHFVDENVESDPEDDVTGSFRNGWGIFIFNTSPARDKVVVQVVHPQDDFIAVPVALELYIRMDARVLMINGAGREVAWDTANPPYNNSKSLSDPSRNARHPYHAGFQVLFDELDHGPADQLVTIQMHSFDGTIHGGLADAHVTAACEDDKPNPPIRDVAEHLDLVNLMNRYPVDGLSEDPAIRQRIDRYVSLWCNPVYAYYGDEDTLSIWTNADLCGYSGNQQAHYCHDAHPGHAAHNIYVDPENFIHIELDEYPDALWNQQNPNWSRWLSGPIPATMETYSLVLEYYEPFIAALDSAVWHSHYNNDTIPPLPVELYQITKLNSSEVYLRWSPQAEDRAFDTYRLYFDTVEVSETSPYLTRTTSYLASLRDYHTTASVLKGLTRGPERYYFAVGSRDIWGNIQPHGASLQVTDGPITDVTVQMLGTDTLEFNWSGYPGDSIYAIYRQMSWDSAFVFFLASDTNQVRIAVTDTLEPIFYRITRVLKP